MMNKENSQSKTQGCPSRAEKAEWHTESKSEESKCHCKSPHALENFLNCSALCLLGTGLNWPKILPKELGQHIYFLKNYTPCSSFIQSY